MLGYLVCVSDCQIICLGYYVQIPNGPSVFEPVQRDQSQAMHRALRRFLAEHLGHQLIVIREEGLDGLPDFATVVYREIGGDSHDDIPLKEYLKDVPSDV